MPEFLYFLGRFHPLMLHLPIGILSLAFLMELSSRHKKFTTLRSSMGFILGVGAFTAVLTAFLGYWLSLEGGYEEKLLQQHQWLGIATAVLSGLVFWFHQNTALRKLYFPTFILSIIVLIATGHLGGNLTHGSDFLMEKAPNSIRGIAGLAPKEEAIIITDIQQAIVFRDLIDPILQKKCVSCHNPSKKKGELLMNKPEGLKMGGESGVSFIAFDPENSLMIERLHLPLEEKEHMPPKGKRQLEKEEIVLLEWWIKEGADFQKTVASSEMTEDIKRILDRKMQQQNPVFTMDLKAVKMSQLDDLKAQKIKVFPLARNSPFLEVDLSNSKDLKSDLKSLKKLRENIVYFDLSNSDLDDELMKMIADFPHLIRLNLHHTKITDKGIQHISNLIYLENINLYQTVVSDQSIGVFGKMEHLKKLYLWKTEVTMAALQELQEQKQDLLIRTGMEQDTLNQTVQFEVSEMEVE